LQKSRQPRRSRRVGASAEFARAMARAEFGRHYVDDKDLEEVQRSLQRAKAPVGATQRPKPPGKNKTGSKRPA
jgi:hypothetical protein